MATILVVDDRPINLDFLAMLLSAVGHRVIEAADGAEALERVRRERPDLVISDILMPTMDGIEFAQRLHADVSITHIPVIFYTATYRLTDARRMAESCDVSTVLPKPSRPQVILEAVNAALHLEPAATTAGIPGAADAREAPSGSLAQHLSFPGLDAACPAAAQQEDEQGLSLRLSVLIELGLEMAAEREPQRLLDMACGAAQDILSARYAGVGFIGDDGGLQRYAQRGLCREASTRFGALVPVAGMLGEVFRTGTSLRRHDACTATAALPDCHPPVATLLAVPVKSARRRYGWLYLAERLAGGRFSGNDEQIALTLATQLALAFENLELYRSTCEHAVALEREITQRKRAAAERQESELRLRQVAENIREVFFLRDAAASQVLYVSPAYEEIWGRSCASLYARPSSWMDSIHPDDQARMRENTLDPAQTASFENVFRLRRPDGSQRWVRARGFPIRDTSGQVYRVAGVVEDITEHKAQEDKIARLNRIQSVLSGINSAIVRIHEGSALFTESCRVAVECGGFGLAWIGLCQETSVKRVAEYGEAWPAAEPCRSSGAIGKAIAAGQAAWCNDLAAIAGQDDCGNEALARGYRSLIVLPLMLNDACVAVMALYAREANFFDAEELRLLKELAGDISFALCYIEREERLSYLAYHDVLTGLPSAALFQDRLTQLVHRVNHGTEIVAVIVADIDRFTHLNDTLGRHIGDRMLRAVAERLLEAMHEEGTVARIAADSFAVAIADLQHSTDAAAFAQSRIFLPLSEPFSLDGHEIRITARAGIALYPGDGEDAPTLFRKAEAALREAKASGQRCLYYAPEINARLATRVSMERKLELALERQQFILHFQPRVDLASGRMVSAEALIRWQAPEEGLIHPDEFIPLAEECGLIAPLWRWVIESVCAQQEAWRRVHLKIVPIAVNLSATQIQDVQLLADLQRTLAAHGMSTNDLELELTESAVMHNPAAACRALAALRGIGLRLSLDDFGTGYSSLAYLKRFPFDFLKIDRAFVTDIPRDAEGAAIATAIIVMAHSLKLRVVAEGVETEEQLAFLRAQGCDEIQGYYFSRPLPVDAFEFVLRSGMRLSRTR